MAQVTQKRTEEMEGATGGHVHTETQNTKGMTKGRVKVVADKSSDTQTATFHIA